MARTYDFSQLNVLVVDDNKHMRMLVAAMLQEFGVKHIYTAEDGSEALAFLRSGPMDLVITDYMMAPMDGIELTKHLRNQAYSPNPYIPVIMMTGHTEKQRVLAARDAGVTEFLAKPISVQSLLLRLVNCIERPRPYVKTKTFFGPCRRRIKLEEFAVIDRRGKSPDEIAAAEFTGKQPQSLESIGSMVDKLGADGPKREVAAT